MAILMGVEVPMLVGVDLIDNHHRLLLLSSRSALMFGHQTSFQTLCLCNAWVGLMEYLVTRDWDCVESEEVVDD